MADDKPIYANLPDNPDGDRLDISPRVALDRRAEKTKKRARRRDDDAA